MLQALVKGRVVMTILLNCGQRTRSIKT
uniref:Uncharacterized protein n=1 Tax=Rhizophora mucronata TaxID=61149 RepID=A0A2P2Q638_RHIMU